MRSVPPSRSHGRQRGVQVRRHPRRPRRRLRTGFGRCSHAWQTACGRLGTQHSCQGRIERSAEHADQDRHCSVQRLNRGLTVVYALRRLPCSAEYQRRKYGDDVCCERGGGGSFGVLHGCIAFSLRSSKIWPFLLEGCWLYLYNGFVNQLLDGVGGKWYGSVGQ